MRRMVGGLRRASDLLSEVTDNRAVLAKGEVDKALAEWEAKKKMSVSCDIKGFADPVSIDFRWCNIDQIKAYINKNPGSEHTAFAGAILIGAEEATGYPYAVYTTSADVLSDHYRMTHIVQPSGAKGMGGRWWFNSVEDGDQWWIQTARPKYVEMFKSEKVQGRKWVIEELVETTKEAIQNGSFPWLLKNRSS